VSISQCREMGDLKVEMGKQTPDIRKSRKNFEARNRGEEMEKKLLRRRKCLKKLNICSWSKMGPNCSVLLSHSIYGPIARFATNHAPRLSARGIDGRWRDERIGTELT